MAEDIDTLLLEAGVRSKHIEAVNRLNDLTNKLDHYIDVEEKRIDEGAECSEGQMEALEKIEDDMESIRAQLLRVQQSIYGGLH